MVVSMVSTARRYDAYSEGERLVVKKQRTHEDYLAFADRQIEARDFVSTATAKRW